MMEGFLGDEKKMKVEKGGFLLHRRQYDTYKRGF